MEQNIYMNFYILAARPENPIKCHVSAVGGMNNAMNATQNLVQDDGSLGDSSLPKQRSVPYTELSLDDIFGEEVPFVRSGNAEEENGGELKPNSKFYSVFHAAHFNNICV